MDSQGPADVFAVRSGDSVSVNNPYGVPGGILNTIDANYFQNFVYAGDNDFYEHDKNRQLSARFDLTTQFSTDHELKLGFEIVQQRVNRFVIGGMGTFNGIGVSYPVIDFYEKSPNESGLSVTDGNDLGTGYTPITTAAYAQYQLRYQGMFINLGLRYDHYNAQTQYRINPIDPSQADPFLQERAYSSPESQLSPRVGIAFPITDRIVLRFNYGQFFSRPSMTSMFSHLWNNFNQADVDQGNPNIAAQRTTSYELGLSWLLRDDLAFDATAFNKNMFYLEGYREVLGPNLRWYFQDQNKEYGNSYGIELSLRKRYSDWISGTANYTLSYANGTSSDVSELSRYPITAATFAKSLGYQPLYPQDLRPMAFDRRHMFNLILDFDVPIGEGPELFGTKLLSGFGVDMTGTFQSGTPYTPLTSFFMTLTSDQFNSASFPATVNVDMRIHKDFLTWSGIKVGVFANIYNVLNLDMPFAVFKGSGNADNPAYLVTPGAISPESYSSTSPLYSKVADSNHDGILSPQERFTAYQRLQEDMLGLMPNYSLPRRALFGIELRLE
jgi:outer membrane receptor protein involved in Fe transport